MGGNVRDILSLTQVHAYERIAWHYTESEARVSQSDTDEATLDSLGD